MTPAQRDKVLQFINNPGMADAVYQLLLDTFLREHSADVQYLAASRLSVDFLKQGFARMRNLRAEPNEQMDANNIGL